MLLELLRPLSFLAGMLSLYPVMLSAFFAPGTHWEERLAVALLRVAIAACLCLTSGLLYAHPAHHAPNAIDEPAEPLLRTLPIRLFLCAIAGMALLFLLSWWLDTYYIPLTLRHGCCRP